MNCESRVGGQLAIFPWIYSRRTLTPAQCLSLTLPLHNSPVCISCVYLPFDFASVLRQIVVLSTSTVMFISRDLCANFQISAGVQEDFYRENIKCTSLCWSQKWSVIWVIQSPRTVMTTRSALGKTVLMSACYCVALAMQFAGVEALLVWYMIL